MSKEKWVVWVIVILKKGLQQIQGQRNKYLILWYEIAMNGKDFIAQILQKYETSTYKSRQDPTLTQMQFL